MYKLEFYRPALKAMGKFKLLTFVQIFNDIADLKLNPRPHGYIKLTDRDGYRIRSGDYRILYEIDDEKKIIYIANIPHRKDAYKS